MLVSGVTNSRANGSNISSYTYSYDNVGNITAVNGSTVANYSYDNLGQLRTETYGGKTYTYSYDAAGNIVSVSDGTTTKNYVYGDSSWKDLLTSYNGGTISYDGIGNPTKWYDGTNFTWVNGRRLASAVNSSSGVNNSYTYDADGLRLTKTVNGVQHRYVWQGSQLVAEYYGGTELEFFYDESGAPYAFSYKANASAAPVMYYYVTNLQGDVTNIVDASGNVNSTYTYNAWGKIIFSAGTMSAINPIRYRGYYYDTETGLYYLQSRYYDPEICRFVNADSQLNDGDGPLGYNVFAYCNNDPVMCYDPTGHLPILAITAVAGAVFGAVSGGIKAARSGNSVWKGALKGAAIGGAVGLGVGAVAGAALAGSATASVSSVVTGAKAVASLVGSAGVSAGSKMILDNVSQFCHKVPQVFWSGGDVAKNAAKQVANNIGGKTLEMTRVGTYLEEINATRPAWKAASSNFANVASNSKSAIYSIQNSSGIKLHSIWAQIEFPLLKGKEVIYGVASQGSTIQILP